MRDGEAERPGDGSAAAVQMGARMLFSSAPCAAAVALSGTSYVALSLLVVGGGDGGGKGRLGQ